MGGDLDISPHPGGGIGGGGHISPKPLCVSNKPSPARLPLVCLVSPPHTCPGSSRCCRGTRFASRPADRGGMMVGSPGSCSSSSAAPHCPPPSPAIGSRGAQRAPSLGGRKTAAHGWALPLRGEGFGSPPWGWLLPGVHRGPRPHSRGVTHPFGANPQCPKTCPRGPRAALLYIPTSQGGGVRVVGGVS